MGLKRIWQGVVRGAEKAAQRIPAVQRRLEAEYAQVEAMVRSKMRPKLETLPDFNQLPEQGVPHEQILEWLQQLRQQETPLWEQGRVSGTVYHGGAEHSAFLSQVYALHSQSNPLHADLFPSTIKFEAEIVRMTANLLHAPATDDPEQQVVGTTTSGGTESILLAMKTYRDWAHAEKGVTEPEVIAPETAHPAFDKAAHLFCIKLIRTPVGDDFKANLEAIYRAITRNTIALVGSAPGYPHGVIDPIPQIAQMAKQYGIGMHVDGCLGGFLLPFIEALGYPVPPFDFRVEGVTSISVDPHKYGYTPKGLSVVLYRGRRLRRYQYFTATDWQGGLYASPTLPGSRPGALSVAGWAAMVSIGRQGYLECARQIMETAKQIRKGIEQMPELKLMGEPLFLIAFTSAQEKLNIYQVFDQMARRGWRLTALQRPPGLHFAVTIRHTQPGVAEAFLRDLRDAVDYVKAHPDEKGDMAPIYGMANSLPFRGVVDEVLKRYLDALYD
ncbi:MAG: aspartate aminotransferase family protein [Armatimonadetes bacterium CP1_7O]|nr:MAG: aspartate aminotransferase family protein [Armatimonadetes bacterium CP1_7O]